MAITTFDGLIARVGSGHVASEQAVYEQVAATTSTLLSTQVYTIHSNGAFRALPTPLPSGVSAYIPTRFLSVCSTPQVPLLFCRLVNLGSLNIATPTFTDGSAFPTVTEAGSSRSASGAVLAEVTTVLNATPGSITITYVDQDGNTAETTASMTLTASAAVGTCAWMTLNAADYAVQDITDASRTGGTTPTGVIKFWGVRPLMIGGASASGIVGLIEENLITHAFSPQRLDAADIVYCIAFGSTAIKTTVMEMFTVGDTT